jgi:hypothetical protein
VTIATVEMVECGGFPNGCVEVYVLRASDHYSLTAVPEALTISMLPP